jgi:hypothetical protein
MEIEASVAVTEALIAGTLVPPEVVTVTSNETCNPEVNPDSVQKGKPAGAGLGGTAGGIADATHEEPVKPLV